MNPYTGVALKDEPAILFIELVNEPWHHPEDLDGSVRYIDALTDAVRRTGCRKLVFYNVSQDFRIGEAIRRSQGAGRDVRLVSRPGSTRATSWRATTSARVDGFPDMLRPELARLPRIVYEFDSPDLRNGTMYPAMARTFRSVGAQFAAMFAYDMLATASRNLGWQTHYLNLAYTPRKAVGAVIAAEAMRRLPRMRSYGPYPRQHAGSAISGSRPRTNLAELVARDAFLYAGSTRSTPPEPAALRRIAGYGSSPVVSLRGRGGVLPRPGAPRGLAARGVSRRRAGARPVRAAQPRQDRDPGDPPRLADDGGAAGPGRRVHGPADRRGATREPCEAVGRHASP